MAALRVLPGLVLLLWTVAAVRCFLGPRPQQQSPRTVLRATAPKPKTENPFDVLGLPRGTSQSDARKAFRRIALSEHPDVNPEDPEAEKRFQKLVNAYNAIMGDEIFPDEVMEIRVQMTKRYRERVNSEINDAGGLMYMGNARLIQGVITILFFGVLYALSNTDQTTLVKLLMPPQSRGF
mmetsp:Transcript_40340/g.94435  ORF Transcript_40340/g.94435 Transcript_40340/m.94435 type:complete len:180 (-) Transcript_40340:26-565(-)